MVQDAKSFLVVDTRKGAFGKADTLAQAVKNCKREAGTTGKQELRVVAFSCAKDEVKIEASVDLHYYTPKDAVAVRFDATL